MYNISVLQITSPLFSHRKQKESDDQSIALAVGLITFQLRNTHWSITSFGFSLSSLIVH